MNDVFTAAALAASSGLTAPLRGEESTTWLGSEDLSLNGKLPKTRKPYTITKQRERWSEEEHARFVEALRLHGRAWRKIEEHIGTKTAVQIRSHAQKFFNKLEKKKEAGEAVEKEEDLTIPPPRPKRKPAKPYPRKDDGITVSGAVGTSQLQCSPDMQAALEQYIGSYATTPTGAAAAAQQLGGLMHSTCGHNCSASTVSDATVAAVTAAASAAAAAAAAAVVAAAGQEVQTHMQAHPPSCFPFFGMPPSAMAQITPAHGVSALDQAALLSPATAAAAAKAAEFDHHFFYHKQEGVVPAAPAPGTDPMDEGGMADGTCSDRGLVEATGTTDGTHISANAQTRGSDGDSACSRETDNQGEDPSHALDISWQSKLNLQALQQQQHDMSSASPSAAAAASRSLAAAAAQAGGFDLGQCSWGLDRPEFAEAAAAALQGLSSAQAIALLSNPYYKAGLAAADRSGQQAALQAAAAMAAGYAGNQPTIGLTRTRSGAAGSSGAVDGATEIAGRTKSRRTAPSVNSGSTGPPTGTKRLFAVASEECLLPAKKVARDLSDTGEEGEGMEVTPSSPSIQEKDLKAVSQPSNTNGNTSGSNESEGSKRRQGTAQAEGSNPTNGNSSGNGCSVKDSNTATNTGTNGHTNGNGNYSCGNGTSAFNPVGHHHHHHSHQAPAGCRTNHTAGHHQQHGASGGTSRHQHHHHSSHPAQLAGGEGSNGGAGASGIGFAHGRDEGRSSSDMEGPTQQQLDLQQHRHLQCDQAADDEVMVPVEADDMQQQHQDSGPANQLQALMASLHGMCGNPLMLQQAYGAAAAAAATAQQLVSSSVHANQQHARYQQDANGMSSQQQIAALQQQIREHSSLQNPPASQGFAPWHGSSTDYGGSNGFVGNSLLQQLGQGSAAQQLRAAAGLVGLAGNWGAGNSAAGDALLSTYAQLAAAAAQQQHQQHTHQHNHYHYHQQQQQQQRRQANSASAAATAAAVGLQQLQQGFRHSSSSNPSAGLGSYGGYSGLSGLDVLTRAASASTLEADEGQAGGQRRSHTHLGRVLEEALPGKRQNGAL